MDKSTLSGYGWVIIVTLVLAVMLAFATPFGKYVGQGAGSVIKGFVGAGETAMSEDNRDALEDEWNEFFEGEGEGAGHGGVIDPNAIPQGGTYYKAVNINTSANLWELNKAETIAAGGQFPATPTTRDVYIYDGWIYVYNGAYASGCPYTVDGVSGVYSETQYQRWLALKKGSTQGPMLTTICGATVSAL